MQQSTAYEGSRLLDLPNGVRGLVYDHLTVADLARAKAVNKTSRTTIDDHVPGRLERNAAARQEVIDRVSSRVMQLTDTQQDDGRFGGDSDRKWEHIANAQVDVVIGMMRSGLDADSILETFCNLEEFYPHLASPKKVTELLKKVIVACVPKLKHTAPGCKLNAMGFIAGWIMAKMAETRASDPEFLTTCEAAHSAISALATSLTRKDLLGPSDERRMGQVAAALVISWSGVLGNSITEKTIAGYFRSSYEVAWKALDRAGGDEVTKNFKRITVDLARNHGVVDKVTAWLDAHVTSRTAKRNQK